VARHRDRPDPKQEARGAKLSDLVADLVRTVRMVVEIIDAIRRGLGV